MFVKQVIVFLCVITKFGCYGEFSIPEVTLEAYSPKGLRASIPALPGIQMFAFHANINKDISQVDPGDYRQDYTAPEGKVWSYYNPDLVLKVGDVVHYWIFIQYAKLGYRKDNQKWEVTELVTVPDSACESSISVVSGKTVICKNSIVFEDNFIGQNINTKKWLVEQYIPTYNSVDYEFNSYQKKQCYINGDKLFIKPHAIQNEEEVNGELDFRSSCTRKTEYECHVKREVYLIVPPVASGRIVSNFKFRYGKVEIKAKLPTGDWIYPQVYLEQVDDPNRKLWISYARGNNELLLKNQEDIGGKLLFGGPIINPREPERSEFLKTLRQNKQFTKETHIYTVVWTKDHISLLVDGKQYGEIKQETMDRIGFADNDMVRIVLGVGIGGVNDFPDNVQSGTSKKPWINSGPKQVKTFFNQRQEWLKTWTGDNNALQVEYVKIWAL